MEKNNNAFVEIHLNRVVDRGDLGYWRKSSSLIISKIFK
jgi:hypothetical protein